MIVKIRDTNKHDEHFQNTSFTHPQLLIPKNHIRFIASDAESSDKRPIAELRIPKFTFIHTRTNTRDH